MQTTILEANAQNVQEVVEASMQCPVVFNFYSPSVPECQPIANILQQEANRHNGAFVLANVNCDNEQDLAGYFRIQALPTVLVMVQGQSVDGFAGPQPQAVIEQLLAKYLPSAWQLKLDEATLLIEKGELELALPLLREAIAEESNAETRLALAGILLDLKRADEAKSILLEFGLADKDSRYDTLIAKLHLLEESADTPEIRALQQQLQSEPDNQKLVVELAVQLHQAGRHEEALSSLFDLLKVRLDAVDGEARTTFLDMVKALGATDPTASQYRRRFYSLLY